MKRLFLSFLIGLCYVSAFGQYKFTLDIKTQILPNTKMYLEIYSNRNHIPIRRDSFLIVNGQHTITGEVKQPSNFATFFVKYKGKSIATNFVLDSGKNNISLELPKEKFWTLTLRSDTRGNLIFNDLNNLFDESLANYHKPTRVNGILNIPLELSDEITRLQLKRLESYPNDFAGLIYLYRISRMNAEPTSSKANLLTLSKFSENLRNSEVGKQLYAEETTLIKNKTTASAGNKVPIFQITDLNNKLFSNQSLKGQPYVIVFSATWCGPCQQELPILKKLYDTYKQKGLKVIYFNDDDDVTRWKAHVSKNKLTWINVSEKLKARVSKIPKSFGVYAIPTCLVIDKQGIIVFNSDQTGSAMNQLESFIKTVTDI